MIISLENQVLFLPWQQKLLSLSGYHSNRNCSVSRATMLTKPIESLLLPWQQELMSLATIATDTIESLLLQWQQELLSNFCCKDNRNHCPGTFWNCSSMESLGLFYATVFCGDSPENMWRGYLTYLCQINYLILLPDRFSWFLWVVVLNLSVFRHFSINCPKSKKAWCYQTIYFLVVILKIGM